MCKGTANLISYPDFNHGLLQAVREATPVNDNFVASPVSVLVLLSALLTAKGPEGKTATEVCKAVSGIGFERACETGNFTYTENKLEEIRVGVENSQNEEGQNVLTLSNGVFMQNQFRVSPGFLRSFAMLRSDRVGIVDFKTADAFDKINAWVREATGGLIEKLFSNESEIDKETLLILLNAITFKDKWARQFPVTSTNNDKFTLNSGEAVTVPMMRIEEEMIMFSKGTSYKLVSKAFRTHRFQFVVVLPQKGASLSKIENDLEGSFPWEEVENLENLKQIHLTLPRFKVEDDIDLTPILKRLGIQRIFDRGLADLTGISRDAKLYVSKAKQVAVMEVDEYGAKAAAVTSISIMPMSMPPPAEPFTVDRPFYCAIYDTKLKMPLFVARVMDPR